ncbi:MAG: hypothetical protein ACW98Y_04265 [Candidatus Thorarchaeota archaeon]|jgi:ABC-type uncharacterized transport system permease subunit
MPYNPEQEDSGYLCGSCLCIIGGIIVGGVFALFFSGFSSFFSLFFVVLGILTWITAGIISIYFYMKHIKKSDELEIISKIRLPLNVPIHEVKPPAE